LLKTLEGDAIFTQLLHKSCQTSHTGVTLVLVRPAHQ